MTNSEFVKTPGHDPLNKGKNRRRVMRAFKIDEISAVDYPAQEHAKVTIMKRRGQVSTDPIEKVLVLTSIDDGHQHVLRLTVDALRDGGGHTDYTGGKPTEDNQYPSHDHAYVINPDGSITIAVAHGHSHTLEASELMARLRLDLSLSDLNKSSSFVKMEDGKEFQAFDYAHVPDATDPDTWKYRLVRTSGGNPDRRFVGNAVAALKQGKVAKRDCVDVIRRVRTAWLKAHKGQPRSAMPSVLKRDTRTTTPN